ncbi:T9SS type A sorting domain-containing protein [Polaribacter sp. 20A6]|uniref:T9SS type A sorting domain-containing protein n=1 Tax=Polaribacter sp. 20A6 TaxID=2687289 RepID=UPI0013FD5529|nr:T9SS type A sorting domain-containing protein [Polaribacter sp. 20A6]
MKPFSKYFVKTTMLFPFSFKTFIFNKKIHIKLIICTLLLFNLSLQAQTNPSTFTSGDKVDYYPGGVFSSILADNNDANPTNEVSDLKTSGEDNTPLMTTGDVVAYRNTGTQGGTMYDIIATIISVVPYSGTIDTAPVVATTTYTTGNVTDGNGHFPYFVMPTGTGSKVGFAVAPSNVFGGTSAEYSATIKLEFFEAGTYSGNGTGTPIEISPIFEMLDIDFDPNLTGTEKKEFVTLYKNDFENLYFSNNTFLSDITSGTNAVTVISSDSNNVSPLITDEQLAVRVDTNGITDITFTIGSKSGHEGPAFRVQSIQPVLIDDTEVGTAISGNPISANNDSGSVNKGYGGTAIANVVANDKLNSTSTTIGTSAGQVTLSQTSSTNAGIVLNTSTGEITVTTTVPAGTYSVVYEICEAGASPANCDSATAIVNVVLDTDNDGVPDATDEDDDNDGILDTEECTSVLTYNDSFEIPDLQAETPDLVSKIDGDGDTEIDFLINQTSVEGWVTTDTNTFDIAFDAFNASDGDQSIDLYGTPSATGIQKTFSGFTEGIPVAFSLDYSSVAGLFEATISVDYGDGPIFITTLQPNNIATSDSPNTAGSRIASIVWASYTANLLPTSTGDIKIIIQSTSLGSGQSGVLIDNVTLSQPTCPDTDRDSIPNHLDSDSDNDGCSDADEAYFVLGSNPDADTDNNGYYGTGVPIVNMTTGRIDGLTYTTTPNAYYLDAAVNTCNDSDNDGVPDALDLDSDNDGILDSVEINLNCPSTDYIDLGTTFTNTTTGTNGGNSSGTTSNLYTFEGVEASFSFETTNSATWASGVASAGPTNGIDGNYINVQPINTKFPLGSYYPADAANIDVAVYKLTFTKPVHNLEFKWGGLDNDDRVDFTANLNGTNVPLTITNNTLPSNSYTISGQSVTSTNAGSNAPNNSVIVSLTGPVTEIIFVAGKNNLINTASNVTMQLFELKYCLATDTDNDGIPNYLDLDSDGDGISDVIEAGGTDTDGDSMADGGAGITPTTSGIPSSAGTGNTPPDTDTDNIPNYLDLDSDNDGIYDILEAGGTDDNADGIADNTSDSDNDGLADIYDGSCVTPATPATTKYATSITASNEFSNTQNAIGSPGSSASSGPIGYPGPGPYFIVLGFDETLPDGTELTISLGSSSGTSEIRFRQSNAAGVDAAQVNYQNQSVNTTGPTNFTYTINSNGTDHVKIQTYSQNGALLYGVEYTIPATPAGSCAGTYLTPPETTSGTPDYLNTDSDGDLCTDAKEAGFTDANNDGLVDGTGGFTATGKVIGSDGYAGTSASVTDSTNNFACLDSDLDGVLDINDLDDDNDGILDSVELSTCTITKVEWNHNSPETPNAATVNTNNAGDSDYATYEDQTLISSPNFTSAPNISFSELEQTGYENNKNTYIISNATEATFTAAKAANKYVQVSYTPAVDLIASEIKLGWSTGAATANDDTFGNFDMAVEMDTNPSFESPTVKDQDFHIGEMIIDGYLQYEIPTTDYLVAGTTYYFRFYIYNNQNGTGFTRFDDISFEHRLICDADADGIPNHLDLDSDNDGITDVIEAGGTDANQDGKADDDDNNVSNTASNGIPTSAGAGLTPTTTDSDDLPDFLDIDADNDGIPDNIEAQPTSPYIAPSGIGSSITDINKNGVDDNYEVGGIGIIPVNTDVSNDAIPDYQDSDSDNDGIPDINENGDTDNILAGTDADSDGLDDNFDDFTDIPTTGFTVNNGINPPSAANLGDEDGDLGSGGEVDYRDFKDSDNDGISDANDLDDDNDGIPDSIENSSCAIEEKTEVVEILTEDFGTGTARETNAYILNHTYQPTGDIQDGFYAVASSLTSDLASFNRTNLTGDKDANVDQYTGPDNGSTNGRYLVINLKNQLDIEFYRQTLSNLIVGQDYRFRVDLAGICDGCDDAPIFELEIENPSGVIVEQLSSASLNVANDDVWKRVVLNFTAATTSLDIVIINHQPDGADGNDVGVDNIVLATLECPNTLDSDNDGIINSLDLDSDNDGIPDLVEAGGVDTDGNGRVDDVNANGTLINDLDGDGLDDRYDADSGASTNIITNPDTDGDGIKDFLDLDADNDGIPDIVEAGGTDANGDGKADGFIDNDKDGFNDLVDGDTNNDGTSDNILNALIATGNDTNNDGVPDSYPNKDTDNDGIPNHADLDADNDGIADIVEAGGTDVNGDGRADNFIDVDKDGFNDIVDGDPTNILAVGIDTVGANTDNALIVTGTDGNNDGKPDTYPNGDTDKDGVLDIYDLDADNDGIPDVVEAGGTDENGDGKADDFVDADNDGFNDIVDGDPTNALAFGIDTVGANTSNVLIATGLDTNGDGKPDSIPTGDTDGDGIRDNLDLDADNDGIPDVIEAGGTDANGDGRADDFIDTDKDGFNDVLDGDPTNALPNGTDTAGANTVNALILTSLDTDGDGNPDSYPTGDTDNDGIPNYLDLDADNDGIADAVEAGGTDENGDGRADDFVDADKDGFNDAVDGDPTNVLASGTDTAGANTTDTLILSGEDANGDGNPDTYSTGDTDNDGIPNHLDLDADNDGIADVVEAGGTDVNGDGRADNFIDADNDGFNDVVDGDPTNALTFGTDTAGANTSNVLIVTSADTDGDGNPDTYPNGDNDNDGILDHLDLDADNDGIADVVEAGGTDANGDGRADNFVDADNDGFNDIIDGDPTNALAVGTDTSGANTDNVLIITSNDSDGDGKPESYINGDTDNDGILNHLDLDADNDGIADVIEAGGTDTDRDGKADGILDVDNDGFNDLVDGDPTNSLVKGTDTAGTNTTNALIITSADDNSDGKPTSYLKGDADTDGKPNFLDIDADDDGIPDNIEGQPSVGYISPSEVVNGTIGIIDTNNNGVDDKYEVGSIGFIPENTDGTDNPDYLDSDSDNDGVLDIEENGDTNHLLMDLNGLVDTDGDGLNDTFDNNTNDTNGATVNDGVGSNDKILDEASLEDAFGDTDNDFNPGAGDLDYRDIPDPADVMITQVYQFGDEKWIEITNIGEIDIPANTIKIQLYKDKTIAQMIAAPLTEPTVSSITVGTILLKGKSVLFKNTTNSIVPDETNSGVTTVTSAAVDLLTDLSRDETDQTTLNSSNDIITLSTGIGAYSWNNRYDIASNIGNKTSVVRIDERLTTNKDYDVTEWVVFIDDAITPYQPVGTETADIADIVRHPQDPLISEITSSSIEANTLLGLHRIDITTSNSSSNTWTNGFPDRSRSVVIDQDFEHTTNRLSARKLKVDTGVKLAVTDQLLVVTNNITLDGNIRLVGTSQLVQTHTTIPQISGTGKLLVDQNSETPSLYRYGYMSSPVNSSGFIYLIKDVLKDGTTPLDATSTVGTQVAKNINFISGYDGDTTDPISLADYWIYTYSPESNGRSNWTHKNEDKPIDRGDGYIFKGPGEVLQNYTFVGTPNDGEFYTVVGIGANEDYLIGNPFPSAMNARKFMEDNDGSIKQTLYFWEHHESAIGEGNGIDGHIFGGYIGGYATLNLSTGTAASAIAENSSNGTSGLGGGTYKEPEPYIAIAQGFFVEGNGTGGVIKFDNSQRAYVTEGTESIFFKGSAKSSKAKTGLLPIIKLGFEFKNTEDLLLHNQIAISFQETNSFDYDKGYDSEIYEVGKTDFYWKFSEDETKYVIAGVQEISNELEVPLEIIMDYSGQVTLMVDEIINVDNGIYITDKLTGTSYNVKQGRTTLTLEKGLYTGRFVLAFKETSALSVEDDILAGYTSIYADNENHNIVISKNQDIEINKVELFDILGKKVSLWKIKEQKSTYQLEIKKQIPTGIYIVKMKTNKGEMNKKVVIE